jgi:hypothetical protein
MVELLNNQTEFSHFLLKHDMINFIFSQVKETQFYIYLHICICLKSNIKVFAHLIRDRQVPNHVFHLWIQID